MPRKPKPKPLWVTQAAIKKVRANVSKRTQLRIAQLFSESEESIGQVNVAAQQDRIPLLAEKENWHCCLNTICFCALLLLLNLLFFQCLYYQTVYQHNYKSYVFLFQFVYLCQYVIRYTEYRHRNR